MTRFYQQWVDRPDLIPNLEPHPLQMIKRVVIFVVFFLVFDDIFVRDTMGIFVKHTMSCNIASLLWIKPPVFKTPPGFFGKNFENNKTPDPIFENRILKRIKPRAKRGKILKTIKPRAKRGEKFWGIWGTFLILQGKNEAKTKHKFSQNKTPPQIFWKQ